MHKSHKKKKAHHRKNHRQRVNLETTESEETRSDTEQSDCTSILSEESIGKLPYRISSSETMGRFIVAARDFRPGTMILSELPLIVGPCSGSKPMCLGCYHQFDEKSLKNSFRCKGCQWPMCGPRCSGLYKQFGHSLQECTALADAHTGLKLDYSDFMSFSNDYNAVVPLRCLLLKKHFPDCWNQLNEMESHNKLRKKLPDVWNTNQVYVVDVMRQKWGMVQYSEEEVHTICGILEVNAFEVGHDGISIRALYPSAFLLAHDCVPNTNHSDQEKTFELNIRASTYIEKGQIIALSYAHTLQSTLKRRESILENKFFLCECNRCRDPTELGTYTSALKCPKCYTGLVLSTNPLDPGAIWRCNNSISGSDGDKTNGNINTINGPLPAVRVSQVENITNRAGREVRLCSGDNRESFTKQQRKPAAVAADTNAEKNGNVPVECPGYVVTAKSMKILMKRIAEEIDQIDCDDVSAFEAFLKRYCNVLHPNHYHCLAAKQSLSQLYGKIPGYMIHQMSVEMLYRKLDVCREILQIFNVLEPGYSRIRGITLYELHAPLMILATRDFESKNISKIDLRIRLKEIVRYLEEAFNILSLEPKNSPESLMADAAKDALIKIRKWQRFVGKI